MDRLDENDAVEALHERDREAEPSSSSRLTEPLRPNSSCIATAPTNGGMISGSTPSVWISAGAAELEARGEVGERQGDERGQHHRHRRDVERIPERAR